MKTKTKKNSIIIVLIVLLLALALGYAAFSSVLNANGTATGTGTWDVHFKTAEFVNSEGSQDTTHGSAPTITTTATTNDTVTANVKLAYPGDGVILKVVVENSGNTPAKLVSFNVTGADEDLQITQAGPANNEELAAQGGTCTAEFAIKWNPESTSESLEKTFTIKYEYEQNVTNVELVPTHTDA